MAFQAGAATTRLGLSHTHAFIWLHRILKAGRCLITTVFSLQQTEILVQLVACALGRLARGRDNSLDLSGRSQEVRTGLQKFDQGWESKPDEHLFKAFFIEDSSELSGRGVTISSSS